MVPRLGSCRAGGEQDITQPLPSLQNFVLQRARPPGSPELLGALQHNFCCARCSTAPYQAPAAQFAPGATTKVVQGQGSDTGKEQGGYLHQSQLF